MKKICEVCRGSLKFSEKYDCQYCGKCNEWKEKACGDPDCLYCAKRPLKPVNGVGAKKSNAASR